MARSFADFLDSMTIAMEADDITGQTANEVRTAVGGTPSTQGAERTEDEENLSQVDDIFGTQGDVPPADGPSGNPEEDQAGGEEGVPPEEGAEGEEGAEDPNVTGEGGEETPPEEEESDPNLVFTQKNRIRDNLVQLYNIMSGDIEIIVNSLNAVNDMETIQVMNAILNNLRNAKDYTYKTLTQNLASLEYDELLQRYITLKRVYDICATMMKKHFKERENKDKK